MDLGGVKAASRPDLLACVAAAAENTQGLLNDAELLSAAGQHARAYSLAVLAVEEFGKATSLMARAAMPKNLRAEAPVRRMLEWHQLKLVGGMLMAVVTFCPPGGAARLAAIPITQLEQILDTTDRFAEDSDRLKLRGFYVDMDRDGRIRRPSEITENEVSAQLGRARQGASPALPPPEPTASRSGPPPEAPQLSRGPLPAPPLPGDVRT